MESQRMMTGEQLIERLRVVGTANARGEDVSDAVLEDLPEITWDELFEMADLLTHAADRLSEVTARAEAAEAKIRSVGIVPYLDRMKELSDLAETRERLAFDFVIAECGETKETGEELWWKYLRHRDERRS